MTALTAAVLPFDWRVHVAGEAIGGGRGTYGLRAMPRIEMGYRLT